MRPHVNGYCAHENVFQTAHKNPLRQQVAATGCNLTTYQAFHANSNSKWSPNHCYNGGVRSLQLGGKPPTTTTMHYQANYQLQQQQHQQQQHIKQYQQQQHIHPHLQRLNPYNQHGNMSGSGFVAQPASVAAATETMSHNYAKLPSHAVNQQRINECAGIPLISNASTHLSPTHRQRVIRKSSHSPPHIMPPHAQLLGLRTEAYASWNLPPTVRETYTNSNNNNNNINNHWQSLTTPFDNRFQTYVATQQQHQVNVAKCSGKLEKSRLLRYQNSAPAVLSSIENTNIQTTAAEDLSTTTTTTTANAGETKMMAETCLPRIIKPRKRRKKERKPNNNNMNTTNILISEQNKTTTAAVAAAATTSRAMKLNMMDCKQFKSSENIFKQFQAEKYANVNVNANANSLLPFYALGSEQLTNKTTITTPATPTTMNNFISWNFNDENNLRSIWDYPLRRSFSDSSATNSNLKLCNNIWDAKSSASSSSSSSSSSSASSSSSSSFSSSASASSSSSSSTYSLSSSTADSFFSADLYASRAEIVGVIGSNRHVNEHPQQQQSHLNDINVDNIPRKALLSACLSDSNDSGYGDILTGINIANDLFNHTSTTTTTSLNSFRLLAANNNNNNTDGLLNAADEAANILLLPATAETLLNESINEISRKLIETCGNETLTDFSDATTTTATTTNILETQPQPHSACFSTCSDFSNDSGIETNNNLLNCNELIFNFDNLHMHDNNNNKHHHQHHHHDNDLLLLGTPLMSELATTMENFLMHLNDENNNEQQQNETKHNQQFVKNCLNLVWPNGNEEVREPSITTMLNSMVKLNTNTTAFSSH